MNELSIEQSSAKILDPYDDSCLLTYLKNRRHIAGASKKQVKRVENSAKLYKLKEDGTIMARKNPSFEFTITIPKPEDRIELILKEHEMSHNKTGKILLSLTSKNFFGKIWKSKLKK